LTMNTSSVVRVRLGWSVKAMSRTDCSLIELCQGFSQIAGLVRR
jgi:hypothetical protein